MTLFLLIACAPETVDRPLPDDTEPAPAAVCPPGRRIDGVVSGVGLGGSANVRVAALDASAWPLDDAADLSDAVTPGAEGAFTVCLDEIVPLDDVYAKAIVAAWADLDGDDRYDARAEALCDRIVGAAAAPYLFYGTTGGGLGWTVGVAHLGFGALSDAYTPVLDGDACTRRSS